MESLEEVRERVRSLGLDTVEALAGGRLYVCLSKRVRVSTSIVGRIDVSSELEGLTCVDGALEVYVGIVKRVSGGEEVRGIEILREPYSEVLLEYVARLAVSMSGASSIRIAHREGFALPGEPMLFIACCAETRYAARECVSRALDLIKLLTPLTKVEVLADGSRRILVAGLRIPIERASPSRSP